MLTLSNPENRITNGVVSVCYPKQVNVEWRNIPGFSHYRASNLGIVRYGDKAKTSKLIVVPSTKGSYFRVSALSDDGEIRSKEVHHLVCLAFHGEPPNDGRRYEVNHRDGNKHNNLPGNLEWITRSGNLKHAYATGLRKDNCTVDVYDTLNGITTTYYSVAEFEREFGLKRSAGSLVLESNHGTLWQERYQLSLRLEDRKVPGHSWIRDLKAYDHVDHKTIVAEDMFTLAILTGVKRGTISYMLKSKSGEMLAGYSFKYLDDETPWSNFTVDEAVASRERYKGKAQAKRLGCLKSMDYTTGKETFYRDTRTAARDVGMETYIVSESARGKKVKLIKGKMFTEVNHKDEVVQWPNFSQEYITYSLDTPYTGPAQVKVRDMRTNTTEFWKSLPVLANALSVDIWVIQNAIKKGTPVLGRYVVERKNIYTLNDLVPPSGN